MTLLAHFRRVFLPLISLISILVACPSFAVTMDVNPGFDGMLKSGVWTPLAIQLNNTSAEEVKGTIVVTQVQGSNTAMPVCTSAITLPANSSSKLYHVYVRVLGYGGDLNVSLMDGNNQVATKTISVNPASKDDRIIVSVGDRSSRLAFLQGEVISVPAGAGRPGGGPPTATLQTGSISPAMLPDRPAAYEGASVIVLSSFDPAAVNPNALKALKMWVASGGTLVVSAGADYQRYTNDFFKELLPVTVSGAANLAGAAGMATLGKVDFPAAPVAVTRTALKPGIGYSLVAEGGVPLVAERAYGAGRVMFLAFDYKTSPFRDWNGQADFWKGIVQRPGGVPVAQSITLSPQDYSNSYGSYGSYPGQPQPGVGMMEIVAQTPSVKMPSFSTIGSFLLAYLIVLVPINYAVLKRKRKLELAWITTPVIVIAFTIGAYAIGYTMKGSQLRVREAVLIEGSSGAQFARMVANTTIFSPARRSYDLQVKDPSVISQLLVLDERSAGTPAYMDADTTKLSLDMPMWSSKSLEAVGGMDLGGTIDSRLTLDGDRLWGAIINNTKLPLRECKLGYGGNWADVPELKPGESINVDVKFNTASGTPVTAGEVNPALYRFAWDKVSKSGGPVLLALSDTDTPVFDLPDEGPTVERGRLCVFHLGYDVVGKFSVPSAAVGCQLLDPVNVDTDSARPASEVRFYDGGSCTLLFDVPVPVGSKITGIFLDPSGDTTGVSFKLLNQKTGAWEAVTVSSGSGGKSIPNAANYVSPGNQVKVKIAKTRSGYQSMSLNVSAEGTSQQ